MKNIDEPLIILLNKYNFDFSMIKKIVCGKKYFAVQLQNGNIGVCATLGNNVSFDNHKNNIADINNVSGRIILNAYYNALLNYENIYKKEIDIFDEIDFRQYNNIVMIGYFDSLEKKFKEGNIHVSIFDKLIIKNGIIDDNLQSEYIVKADALIISSTTIFNNTFINILNNTSDNCKIFMLGPSSILSTEMFAYKNIKGIFGSVFHDDKVLEIINDGCGTKDFLKYGSKVFLLKN